MPFKVLTINPGSTSTKMALFEDDKKLFEEIIRHDSKELAGFEHVADQFDYRMAMVDDWLASLDLKNNPIDAVVGRGAPLKPLEGGSYEISERMLDDLKASKFADHASNLGAIMASYLGKRYDIPSMISDPITVDNFTEIARISGIPEIERKCRSHALNLKEVCRLQAETSGKKLEELNFIGVHMGGGISVAAIEGGKIVDVNDGLLGTGPFSPDRAGALPIGGLVKLCYSGTYSEKEMIEKLSKKSGLVAYLGEADLIEVERMIDDGDDKALLFFNAMAYQISKEIGMMAVVLKGNFDSIILTGGMANSQKLTGTIMNYTSFLGRVVIIPGEFEMEALAAAGIRFLNGLENLKEY